MSSLFRKLLFKLLGMFASHFHCPPLNRTRGKGKGYDSWFRKLWVRWFSSLGGDRDMSPLSEMAQSSPRALLGEEGLVGGGGCSIPQMGQYPRAGAAVGVPGTVLPCPSLCGVVQCHLSVGWRVLVVRSRFG